MKKATLETLVRYLDGEAVSNVDELKAELEAELAKGKAKAAVNRAAYAELHDEVINAMEMAGRPISASEIAIEICRPVGKIVYGLTNYWADEVVGTYGKSGKLYTLKA